MFQKYFVEDILINRTDKKLIKIIDVLKDFDYTPYYDYEIKDMINGKHERLSQFILDNKYVSKKEIEMEIHAHESDKEKADAHISELKWLRSEYLNKLKLVNEDKKGDTKR